MRKPTIILFTRGVLLAFCLLIFQLIHAQNWTQIQGITAQDIGVGKNGTVWATGTNEAIYRWNGSSWQTMPGAAVRVAVDPNGIAWVVNRNGNIFKYNAALSNGWELKDGTAKDIGVGADGSVWIIGTGTTGGGYRIYKWNGTNGWTEMGGGAVRIAVDPSGNAWVVNNTNNVFHWEGNTFVQKLGAVKDIGVGANGTVWCTGTDDRIYQWGGSNWVLKTGGASQISVAPDGNAWVVNSGGQVFHTTDAGTIAIRTIFPRKQQYEYSILRALNYGILGNTIVMGGGGTYNNLDDLGKGFGTYALQAAEILFADNSSISADQVIGRISNDTKTKSSVNGILCVLLMNSLVSRQIDPSISFESRTALRNWCANLFWSVKVRSAKAILTEYQKWKADPCTYVADDYKAPPDCALGGLNYTQWYGSHSPPQDVIGKAGLKSVLANNADAVASGVAFAAAAVTIGAAAIALTSVLGTTVVAGTLTASGITIGWVGTSLFAAFGGTGGAAAGGAAAIGGVGFAGVVAAPVAAAILAIVVGTVEGFRVVENAKVEPMLKMKLGSAMASPINITNEMSDSNSRSMFFVAFQEAATKNYQIIDPKVDGEVRFYCQAGYVSSFRLTYTVNGQTQSFTTPDLSVGYEKSFPIPYNATNIKVQGWYALGGWKDLFSETLSRPTFICYTSYGTIVEPRYKTDCPEVGNMTTKPNQLTVTQGGGYAAWIKLTYTLNGQTVTKLDNNSVSAGWRQVFDIPTGSTNIRLQAWSNTGLVWDQWHSIIDKTWPVPPNECIKVYGTTLDPKWDSECN